MIKETFSQEFLSTSYLIKNNLEIMIKRIIKQTNVWISVYKRKFFKFKIDEKNLSIKISPQKLQLKIQPIFLSLIKLYPENIPNIPQNNHFK